MRRIARPLSTLLLATVSCALAACGAEGSAGGRDGAVRPTGAAGATGTTAPGGPVDRAELRERAEALRTRLDMVYVTDLPDYQLAAQSVGGYGDHGFQGSYVRKGGGTIVLSVDEVRGDGAACATGPAAEGATPSPDRCEKDGGSWYHSSAADHTYALERDGKLIRLSADRQTVNRATLRRAAEATHRADDAELARVLPPPRGGTGAVGGDRGDLPEHGDGAPVDPVDPERAGG